MPKGLKYKRSILLRCFQMCALLLIVATSTVLHAQQPAVRAAIDRDIILIGDVVRYELEFDVPIGKVLQFPQWTDSLMRGVDLLRPFISDTTVLDNKRIVKMAALITVYDSGFYQLGPIPFALDGLAMLTPALFLRADFPQLTEVQIAALDTLGGQQIFGIRELRAADLSLAEIWFWLKYYGKKYWFIWLPLLLLLGGMLYYLLKRKPRVIDNLPLRPQVPPHIEALQRLEQLRSKKLWQEGKTKLYYSALTDILRHYMERRFEIAAMEQTTYEILRDMERGMFLQAAEQQLLRELLSSADLVKFARWEPLPTQHDAYWTNAFDFVKNTAETPEAEKQPEQTEVL